MKVNVFAYDRRDGWLVGASCAHAALWALCLGAAKNQAVVTHLFAVFALGLAINWTSNTVSHIHLHTPLFTRTAANRGFSSLLSVLLGIPQSWWKARHLLHHGLAEEGVTAELVALRRCGRLEVLFIVATWLAGLIVFGPAFLTVALPALALGLGLCAVQGYEEHARDADGVDVHAALYNRLWFNDGFHAAHHRQPSAHWTTLPAAQSQDDTLSALPPILRWWERVPALCSRMSATLIDALERGSLSFPWILRYLVSTHARAWEELLRGLDTSSIHKVRIVGGGLFPRTALLLRKILPEATLEIVERDAGNLALAAEMLRTSLPAWPVGAITFVEASFEAQRPAPEVDLLVVPLAFRGERERLYVSPPARLVVVHDWLWRIRGARGVRVSWWLCKRLNLVTASRSSLPRTFAQGVQTEPSQLHPLSTGRSPVQSGSSTRVRTTS